MLVAFGSVIAAFVLGRIIAAGSLYDQSLSNAVELPIESVAARKEANQVNTLLELTEFDRFKNTLDRTSALYDLITRIDTTRLTQYWAQAEELPAGQLQQEIQDVLVQRWAGIDPTGALEVVSATPNNEKKTQQLTLIFREWSRLNPEDLVQHVLKLDQSIKELVVRSVILERDDWSVELLRRFARQLDNEFLVLNHFDQSIGLPTQEWEHFLEEHGENLADLSENQLKVLEHLAYVWLIQTGPSAFRIIRESLPDTFSLYETTRNVALRIQPEQPSLAFDLVVHQIHHESDPFYHRLAADIVEQWAAERNPRVVLSRLLEIEEPGLRRHLENRLVGSWIKNDHISFLREMDELPEHLQSFAQSTFLSTAAEASPEQVKSMLVELENSHLHSALASELVRGWVRKDRRAALDWIKTESSVTSMSKNLMIAAVFSLAEVSLEQAMQTALEHPLTKGERGLEWWVIDRVAWSGDLDGARSLLPQVRHGVTKINSYDSVMDAFIGQGDPQTALDLFIELCEQETEDLGKPLNSLSTNAPNLLYDSLDRIEDNSIRIEAAWILYRTNDNNGRFTDTELAALQELFQSKYSIRKHEIYDRLMESMR